MSTKLELLVASLLDKLNEGNIEGIHARRRKKFMTKTSKIRHFAARFMMMAKLRATKKKVR